LSTNKPITERPTRLKVRFYRNITFALAVPLIFMSLLTSMTAYKNAGKQAVENSLRVSFLFSNSITSDMHEAELRLKYLTELLDNDGIENDKMQRLIDEIRFSQNGILDIRILDLNGIVTMASPSVEDVIGMDMSYTSLYEATVETDNTIWSHAFISPETGIPVASIATTFRNGVIVANYDFTSLRKTIVDMADLQGMEVTVLDSAGTVLAHSDPSRAMRREWNRRSQLYTTLSKQKKHFNTIEIDNTQYLVTATAISETGWTLIVKQPTEAIYAPVVRLTALYVVCSLIFIILGILLSYRFTQWIFEYLQRLLVNIKSVAEGNYDYDPEDTRFTELAEVGTHFTRMFQETQKREEQIADLNQQLQLRLSQAESANKAKNEFLANMSHELRTPLNGALGMLQLLQECNLNKEQEEYTVTAINSCKNLTTLVNDLLDLSRIEAGKMKVISEPFSLHALCCSLNDIFMLPLKEKGLRFSLHLDKRIPQWQRGDQIRLKQVLLNLVGNAIKFTDRGSVSVEVYPLPAIHEDTYRALFMVSDTGIGLHASEIDTIFEPFTQADGSYTRSTGGAGLGLSIVKRLVTLMNGNVAIDSTPGEGTTVFFCTTFGKPPTPPKERTLKEAPEQLLTRNLHILVAEDEQVNRRMITALLNKHDIQVTAVQNGKEALDALEKDHFDIVLMDIQMPVMDGVTAMQAIRESGQEYSSMPIVALTAHAMSGDRELFLEQGFDGYIAKPIDLQDLLNTIRENI